MTHPADERDWPERLSRLRERHASWLRAVELLDACASTQDEALARWSPAPDGHPAGILVVTRRQTAGRGRLGRAWTQAGDGGLAVTVALDARGADHATLAVAAGVAALRACTRALGPLAHADRSPLALRWPNDVVERPAGAGDPTPVRKLAGVLIESRRGAIAPPDADPRLPGAVLLLGVGVNVRQGRDDFPPELRSRAVSLAMIAPGSSPSRPGVLEALTDELARALSLAPGDLSSEWCLHDALVGTVQRFRHDGKVHEGRVERIDPSAEIVLAVPGGGLVRLPALTTSLVQV